jgi:hypothetical protein
VSEAHEQPSDPRDEDPAAGGEPLLRVGTTVGVAFVVALLGSAPAALRLARALPEVGLVSSWSMVGAAALVPAVVLVSIFRGARRGARSFMVERAREHGTTLFFFCALTLPSLVLFGTVLRAKTHHHALAGVTYAIGALLAMAAIASVAARLARVVAARSPTVSRAAFGVAFFTTLASLAWAGARASHVAGPVAGALLDVAALLLASGVGSRPGFLDTRALAVLGPPLAAAMLAFGVTTASGLGAPLAEASAQVSVFAPMLERFAGR